MERVERSIFRRVAGLPSAAWVIVILISTAGQASGQALPVWVSSSLVRVGQTDAPGTTSSINLYSGRGETAASQIAVQAPAGGLTNVNLSVSALTGPNGATIPASNLTLYREYYVTVTGTTNYGGGGKPPPGSGNHAEAPLLLYLPRPGVLLVGTGAPA